MAETEVVLVAGGGHGSVVLDTLLAAGVHVRGVVDPGLPAGGFLFGVPVLGDESSLIPLQGGRVELANGLGIVKDCARRRQLHERLAAQGFRFRTVVHPSALVARECRLADGAQVFAGAILQCGVQVGAGVVVNTGARVDHHSRLGAHTFVGPGAVICGGVVVGDNVLVGAGAVLLPGVRVGDGCTVGAGAVVIADVQGGLTVLGNPARPAGSRN